MKPSIKAALLALGASLTALLLSGCATSPAPRTTEPVTIAASQPVTGRVMGGQQPVAGVSLQLYAVGTSTYGSAATPLLSTPPSTSSNGNFTIPSFNCPSSTSLVYLVGQGGTPIGGQANPNLALMVGLGNCQTFLNAILNSTAFINMNELTTVATVWSLSGFMSGIANIGAPASNLTGIANAFATIDNLVNSATGAASGPSLPLTATLPTSEINALGDILQNCVNSAGGAASDTTDGVTSGTPCGKLFYLSKTPQLTPTDTITAAMNIAQNPAQNVAYLNYLQAASPAFSPSLSVNSPPHAWTIAISYTGGGLSSPQGLATDQSGNVWVANLGNSSVSKFNPTGAAQSPLAGFTAGSISIPYALAIDQSGAVWVANSGNNTVTRLASTGTTGTAYSSNGLAVPAGIAIDGAGDIWLSNSNSSVVSAFTNTGTVLPGSPYSGGGVSLPSSVAISPR